MKKQVDIILKNKTILSGLAILIVCLYHQPAEGLVKGIYFYPGFSGVDIFLFFSGLGLCYSINKNSLGEFYKRRFVRILPLYILLGLFVGLLHYRDYSLWDYICNITSLSYYGFGGHQYEWYLSALIVFYLVFPLFYHVLLKIKESTKNQWWVILLAWAAVLTLFALTEIPWWFQTAIGRLPIFLLGILCYFSSTNFKSGLIIFTSCLIPAVLLFLKGLIPTFVLVYCLAPAIMMALSYIVPWIEKNKKSNKVFSFFGNKSLEIYVSNCVVILAMGSVLHGAMATGVYWLGHIIIVPIICFLNTNIQKLLNVKQTNNK